MCLLAPIPGDSGTHDFQIPSTHPGGMISPHITRSRGADPAFASLRLQFCSSPTHRGAAGWTHPAGHPAAAQRIVFRHLPTVCLKTCRARDTSLSESPAAHRSTIRALRPVPVTTSVFASMPPERLAAQLARASAGNHPQVVGRPPGLRRSPRMIPARQK